MLYDSQAPSSADYIPSIHKSVIYRTDGSAHLFYNVKIPDWIVVSDNAAYILGLFNGHNSLDTIARHLEAEGADISPASLEAFMNFAHERGIVEADGLSPIETLRPVAQPFQSFYLKVTNRCNLECSYCYASSGRLKKDGELTTEEWLDAIDQIKRIRPSGGRITFTGGEPLIRRDLLKLARHAKDLGFSIGLITNGALITEANGQAIATLFDSVQVSLDGDESIHDKERGVGAWKTARASIERLKSHDANYYVSTVLHRANRDSLKAMADEFGARLTVGAVSGFGRAKSAKSLSLSNSEYVNGLKAAGVSGHFDDPQFVEHSRRQPRGSCGVGSTTMSIDENGNVYPCQILISSEFSAGNIRSKPLSSILYDDPWADLRAFSVDTKAEPDARLGCASCWVRYVCGGGCRAKVYSETAAFSGPDGLCELWRSSILNALYRTADLMGSKSVFVEEYELHDPAGHEAQRPRASES